MQAKEVHVHENADASVSQRPIDKSENDVVHGLAPIGSQHLARFKRMCKSNLWFVSSAHWRPN